MDNFIPKTDNFLKKTNKKLVGKQMANFHLKLEEKLLVLSENDKGWTEANRVSFNGAPAK